MSDEQKMIDDIEQLCADVCTTIRMNAPQEEEYVILIGVFASKMLNLAAGAYAKQQHLDKPEIEHFNFIKWLARAQALCNVEEVPEDELDQFMRLQEEISEKESKTSHGEMNT